MKKKLIYGGLSVALIIAAFVFSGYLINAKPTPGSDKNIQNTMFIKAEKVNQVENESGMVYRGRVTAFDNVSLGAEVQGKIMNGEVRFKAGESFNKGDVLINIYKEDIVASLKSGKSSFLQTLSLILPDLKVDYPDEYEKWNSFFKTIDVGEKLPELPEISSDREKVFLAANNVLSSFYTLQQQEINLSRYTIYAPFTGSFKTVNKEIGAIASPGAELATLIRSDKLEISVSVFPSDLKWINKGDKAQITDRNGDLESAIVSRISDFVDETTQSVDVYMTYQQYGNGGLLQGEYVDVNFKGSTVTGFEIPREALVDGNSVYELVNNKLKKEQVEIIRQLDDSYIISGLSNNKIIVTESLAGISDNVEYIAR